MDEDVIKHTQLCHCGKQFASEPKIGAHWNTAAGRRCCVTENEHRQQRGEAYVVIRNPRDMCDYCGTERKDEEAHLAPPKNKLCLIQYNADKAANGEDI